MSPLQRFGFWLGHVLHTRPWVRVLIGALVIVAGVVKMIVGAGTGRLVVFGALLVTAGATASRARRP